MSELSSVFAINDAFGKMTESKRTFPFTYYYNQAVLMHSEFPEPGAGWSV